jgi:hypothetical protein
MAAGTMKTSYYLVTAAGLAAAAAIVYTQWPGSSKAREVPPPTVPLAADAKPLAPGDMTLPPIVTPPDGHLVIPVAAPAAEPQVPPPAAAPQLPAPPSTPPAPLPVPPAEPMVPPVPVGTPPLPTPPAIPPMPAPPAAQPTPTPAPPLLPAPTTPVAPPAAQPTPPPAVPAVPPVTPSPAPMAPPAVVIPPAAPTNPEPPIAPSAPPAAPTLRRVPPADPAAPQEPPAIPAAPPAIPAAPAAPTVPPPAPDLSIPASPAAPVVPMTPPPAPLITPAPPAAQPVLPKPAPLPEPVPAKPSAGAQLPQLPPPGTDERPTSGKYIVLKGDRLGDKLIEGSVAVAGDKAVIRQGSFDRTVAKSDVLFVGESKDEVYRFMLAKVPANDAAARLGVAKWCMFSGLREQALAEAKEILKLQPRNNDAAGMVRSLDESLKNFPGDGTVQVVAKPAGVLEAVEPEPDVTPEGATNFSTRAQPVLANQCMDCHARADYPGAFKLIRVTGFELGPQSTKSNLRAAAAQLKKDDPLNSPLLAKALAAHGGMKQPAFVSRNAAAFRILEAWVLQAVGPVVQPMVPPTPPGPVTEPTPPRVDPIPIIPPAATAPAAPAAPPATPPAIPVIPPADPTPALPVPVAQPDAVPPIPVVLPTPPNLPQAEPLPKAPAPTVVPPIPPAAMLPKPPGAVQPAGGTKPPSQFGVDSPPKPPASGPTGSDEFDPANFNRGK